MVKNLSNKEKKLEGIEKVSPRNISLFRITRKPKESSAGWGLWMGASVPWEALGFVKDLWRGH